MRRVALIGGAFNPPHAGHRKMAELALTQLAVDQVRFMPTATSPHKAAPETPDALDGTRRVKLLRELLRTLPATCTVDTMEVERGGTSYTADTLEALQAREPGTAWILVIGADQAKDLHRWRRAERILALASVAVVPRPGFPLELPEVLRPLVRKEWTGHPGEILILPSSDLPWMSSQVRELLREGIAPEGLPSEVMTIITAENLYRK